MEETNSVPTEFHFTGFGQFCGVPDNPTTHLMKNLPEFLAEELKALGSTATYTVLETSQECIPVLMNIKHDSDLPRKLYVHFGVGPQQYFALEDRGYNEADFRCADESGWQPSKEPIAQHNQTLTFHYRTPVDVDLLQERLATADRQRVRVSYSAGRFICNYVYFHSLQRCQALRESVASANQAPAAPAALFVHVPSFEVIDQAKQLEFVRALVRRLVQPDALSVDVKRRPVSGVGLPTAEELLKSGEDGEDGKSRTSFSSCCLQ